MTSSTEDNQIHRSVLLDHKMEIEGNLYHEKKEMQTIFTEDGAEMSNFSRMRAIGNSYGSYGDRTYTPELSLSYTANYKIVDGEVKRQVCRGSFRFESVWNF